jgi:hypothetical protein
MNSMQLKVTAAGFGAAAAVAMGVVGVTSAEAPHTAGTLSDGPEITMGETSTESAAPTELATSFVSPTMKAEVPDGFGNGGE